MHVRSRTVIPLVTLTRAPLNQVASQNVSSRTYLGAGFAPCQFRTYRKPVDLFRTVHALTLNRCVMRPVFPVSRLGMSVICKIWQMDSGAAPLFFAISQAKLVQRYSDVTCSTFYPVGGRTYHTLLYFGILENHQGKHGETNSLESSKGNMRICAQHNIPIGTGGGGTHWSSHPHGSTCEDRESVTWWGCLQSGAQPDHGSRAPSHKKKKQKTRKRKE